MTIEEDHKQFLQELHQLLAKYKVDIECKDYWQSYRECGEDMRMTVIFDGIWNENIECLRSYSELDLGSYLSWRSV